jgi:hypothetical protein
VVFVTPQRALEQAGLLGALGARAGRPLGLADGVEGGVELALALVARRA